MEKMTTNVMHVGISTIDLSQTSTWLLKYKVPPLTSKFKIPTH